jgi:hypothetical protein
VRDFVQQHLDKVAGAPETSDKCTRICRIAGSTSDECAGARRTRFFVLEQRRPTLRLSWLRLETANNERQDGLETAVPGRWSDGAVAPRAAVRS